MDHDGRGAEIRGEEQPVPVQAKLECIKRIPRLLGATAEEPRRKIRLDYEPINLAFQGPFELSNDEKKQLWSLFQQKSNSNLHQWHALHIFGKLGLLHLPNVLPRKKNSKH